MRCQGDLHQRNSSSHHEGNPRHDLRGSQTQSNVHIICVLEIPLRQSLLSPIFTTQIPVVGGGRKMLGGNVPREPLRQSFSYFVESVELV